MAGPKTPPPPRRFVAGPRLEPVADLIAAVRAAPPRAYFRIPVVARFRDRRAIAAAFVAGAEPVSSDAIALALHDGALGIALPEQLRRRCPSPQETCTVWLEGRWGTLLPAPAEPAAPAAPPDDRWGFSVLHVGELVDPADELRIYIEAP